MPDVLTLNDSQSGERKQVVGNPDQPFGFYCCGPTVYGPAHIGNFRTFVAQDVFRRVAELSGVPVRHVRNITDLDDKTIRVSQEEQVPLEEFTAKWTDRFHTDCRALNLLPPHVEPGAVAHIPEQIALIQRLVDAEHAYVGGDGSVYFRIASFPAYGRLSHLDARDIVPSAEATQLGDEYGKETVADFALWKAWKPEDGPNGWDSPWGKGRPGWHLECSAMSMKYLGETLDLHSGGIDLIFPHHENEIAQSEAATGHSFCRHWFHVTHLMVDGGKMSKSLGNLYTLEDLAAKSHRPEAVRYLLVSGHYRKPINFTLDGLTATRGPLRKLGEALAHLEQVSGVERPEYGQLQTHDFSGNTWFAASWNALLDDLNAARALGDVFSGLSEALSLSDSGRAGEALFGLTRIVEALGLKPPAPEPAAAAPEAVQELAEQRWQAKQSQDWALADQLRDEMTRMGWQVKDAKDGYNLVPAG